MTDITVDVEYRGDKPSSYLHLGEETMPERILEIVYDGQEVSEDSFTHYVEKLSDKVSRDGNSHSLEEALTGHDIREVFKNGVRNLKGKELEEYGLTDDDSARAPSPEEMWKEARDNVDLSFDRK